MSAIDDFHQHILDMADDLGLEGEEHEGYVSFHMEKRGYKKATTWLPPEQDGGDDKGSMFTRKKGQGQGGQQRQGSGGQRQGGSHYFKGSGSK